MPEIKEVPFLKGDDLESGENTIKFLTPHEEVLKEDSGLDNDVSQITIELSNGQKRVWTMNKTCQRMLVGQLGSNSDTWVSKTAVIYFLEQNVRGKLKKVIYVKGKEKTE